MNNTVFPDIRLPRGNLLLVGTGSFMVSVLPVWVSLLRDRYGWNITGCLTHAATTLVQPGTFAAACGGAVLGPDWDTTAGRVDHRWAADWADLVLVAPATGNFVAKCAHGFTDDVATATIAFTRVPVVLAPSLGPQLEVSAATKRNLALLEEDGRTIVPTVMGRSTYNGEMEEGIMPDLPAVLRTVEQVMDADVG